MRAYQADAEFLVSVVGQLLKSGIGWMHLQVPSAQQYSTGGGKYEVASGGKYPGWARRLRDLPCLPDTHRRARLPRELLRRTPETEPLHGIEPFLHQEWDRPEVSDFFDLLGVQSTPPGPEKLLERIREVAAAWRVESDSRLDRELDDLYRRLDRLLDSCSTGQIELIRRAFRDERLIRCEGGEWQTSHDAFCSSNDDEVPGAPVIWQVVAHLQLWRRIGVREQPTTEFALVWLRQLPKQKRLNQAELARARRLLARHALQVVEDTGCWLSAQGEWLPLASFRYYIRDRNRSHGRLLFPHVNLQVADCRGLNEEILGSPSFNSLKPLEASLEERPTRTLRPCGPTQNPQWLREVGRCLRLLRVDDAAIRESKRQFGALLEHVVLQPAAEITVEPFLDGVQAGPPRQVETVLIDSTLYFDESLPTACLPNVIPAELARRGDLDDDELRALVYSFDRSPEQVTAYWEANFQLELTVSMDQHPGEEFSGPEDQPSEAGLGVVSSSAREGVRRVQGSVLRDPQEDEGLKHSETVSGDRAPGGTGLYPFGVPRHPPVPTETVAETAPRLEFNWTVGPRDNAAEPGEERPGPGRQGLERAHRPGQLVREWARAKGFFEGPNGRLEHPESGQRLVFEKQRPLPWVLVDARGQEVQAFHAVDAELGNVPIDLSPEQFAALQGRPEYYGLLVRNKMGVPTLKTGNDLFELVSSKMLRVTALGYRLNPPQLDASH